MSTPAGVPHLALGDKIAAECLEKHISTVQLTIEKMISLDMKADGQLPEPRVTGILRLAVLRRAPAQLLNEEFRICARGSRRRGRKRSSRNLAHPPGEDSQPNINEV